MIATRSIFVLALLITASVCAFPRERVQNPNLEFELLSDVQHDAPKSDGPMGHQSATTPRTVVIKTPPPPDPNSKTFAFNPVSQTWTQLKKNGPPPSEDTLLWNQSNDKFLSNI